MWTLVVLLALGGLAWWALEAMGPADRGLVWADLKDAAARLWRGLVSGVETLLQRLGL